MDIVTIKDKQFRISIPEAEIKHHVKVVAERLNRDMADKNPIFLAVLNGSFIFAADLLREITIPCEISFVKLASYQGVSSTGVITEVLGVNENLSGRTHLHLADEARQATGGPQRGVRSHEDSQRLHRGLRTRLRPAGAESERYLYTCGGIER